MAAQLIVVHFSEIYFIFNKLVDTLMNFIKMGLKVFLTLFKPQGHQGLPIVEVVPHQPVTGNLGDEQEVSY